MCALAAMPACVLGDLPRELILLGEELDAVTIADRAISPPVVLTNRGVQAHLLELLGIEETRPRWREGTGSQAAVSWGNATG
ncbi:hypothetical protein [Streptomyces sp. Y1]|uniref:Uncharacterized protein n=1 Tax=Streptomyces sp. Y1 TaxID=3238634 RepID=A0AB39TX43_9ACTN